MRNRLFLALSALLGSVGLVVGQAPLSVTNPVPLGVNLIDTSRPVVPSSQTVLPAFDSEPRCEAFACTPLTKSASERVWITAEPLMYWLKSAPVSVPLLSTFTPGSPSDTSGFGGSLGVPGTTVLSPNHLGYGPTFGGRATVGGWLDGEQQFGLEASGFLMQSRSASSGAISNGTPSLRALFVNNSVESGFPLGESSFVLADPGFASGGQFLSSSIRLWGAESNALYRVGNDDAFSLTFLGGFRYLDLQEGLSITNQETVDVLGTYVGSDSFRTRNQFYGGQIGAKADVRYDRYFASVQAKVALGVDHESVGISGNSTVFGATPSSSTGGVYTQPSNIGRRTRDAFAVVPAVQCQVGADLTRNIRVFVGYDFLYMSNVARPGDQIDRTLNFTQNAVINGAPSLLIGAARPAPLFNSTDFWAQGITAGIQFRF